MIESALGWIGEIARFVGSLFPRLLIVQASHRGVKYVWGREVVELEPGPHVYWPLVTPVELCAVVRQTIDLPAQLLETADGQVVVASGAIEYEIEDAVAFLAQAENGYDSIRLVATGAVRDMVTDCTLEELRADRGMADRLLTGHAQDDLEPYGVRVLRARLSDFARVRPIHLTGGPSVGVTVGGGGTIE